MTRKVAPQVLALAGCVVAALGLLFPWMSVRGVEGSGESGLQLLGGLIGVTLVLAGAVTAFAPKRRHVVDAAVPAGAGLIPAVVGVLAVITRAAVRPGPEAASAFVVRELGLWITLVGVLVALAGLGLNWHHSRPGEGTS